MYSLTISSAVAYAPSQPFLAMKDTIMGRRYKVSLTFIGATKAKQLNQAYRQKDYVPNVLSFPLTPSVGEVYICPAIAKREAKNFNLSVDGYIAFLFIHGLLHLKGLEHGDTMDREEQKYLKKFRIT